MMQVCTTKSVSMEIPIAAKTNTLRVAKKPLSLHTFLESSSVQLYNAMQSLLHLRSKIYSRKIRADDAIGAKKG